MDSNDYVQGIELNDCSSICQFEIANGNTSEEIVIMTKNWKHEQKQFGIEKHRPNTTMNLPTFGGVSTNLRFDS